MQHQIRVPRRAICGFALSLTFSAASPALATRSRTLFVIARSKNKNVVHYDVRVKSDGRLDTGDPIDAYWILRAEDGRRDELSFFERKLAYGFDIQSDVRASGFRMRLRACEKRPIRVRKHGDRYRAELVIAGEEATLSRIFVQTNEDGVVPKVVHVELFGSALGSGKPLRERLTA